MDRIEGIDITIDLKKMKDKYVPKYAVYNHYNCDTM